MHWLQSNWPMVLGWALYVMSEIIPLLPTKAQTVLGTIRDIGKAILGLKNKPAALPPGDAK